MEHGPISNLESRGAVSGNAFIGTHKNGTWLGMILEIVRELSTAIPVRDVWFDASYELLISSWQVNAEFHKTRCVCYSIC